MNILFIHSYDARKSSFYFNHSKKLSIIISVNTIAAIEIITRQIEYRFLCIFLVFQNTDVAKNAHNMMLNKF